MGRLFGKNMMIVMAAFLAVTMCLGGCDPMRKKFVRQKKKGQVEDKGFVPVLEPQEYAAPDSDPYENYKTHYNLVKAWYRELWLTMDDRSPEKRVRSIIKEMNEHLDGMYKLVNPAKQQELDKVKSYLQYYDGALGLASPLRNRSRIQSDLRAFHRELGRSLTPAKVRKDFVAVEPGDE